MGLHRNMYSLWLVSSSSETSEIEGLRCPRCTQAATDKVFIEQSS